MLLKYEPLTRYITRVRIDICFGYILSFLTFVNVYRYVQATAQINICNKWYRFTSNSFGAYIINIVGGHIDIVGSYMNFTPTKHPHFFSNERPPMTLSDNF